MKGELTLGEAARALNTTSRGFQIRETKWGHRFPLLLATLDKLRVDTISSKVAAELLEVSTREVNNLRETYHVPIPIRENQIQRTASKVKWDVHNKFAIDYIAGRLSIDDVAEATGLSSRQVRRKVSTLLTKHEQISFKEHSKLHPRDQSAMAKRIETAEGLDVSKQMLAQAISSGQKTIKEEAVERVVYPRNLRRKPSGK